MLVAMLSLLQRSTDMIPKRDLLERAAFWLQHEGKEAVVRDVSSEGHCGMTPGLVTDADPTLIGWAITVAKFDLDGQIELSLSGPQNWLPSRLQGAPGTWVI